MTPGAGSEGPAVAGGAVPKRMSLSQPEFWAGIAVLAPERAEARALPVRMDFGGGRVEVSYVARPSARLGGLLELPQADVRIAFEGLSATERAEFERRFWIAFQRGGG